jgi:branched-chain amino acid transport system ATP-binding protein
MTAAVKALLGGHSGGGALSMATRAYVLENGRISMEGKGQDLLNNEHLRKAYPGI